MSIILHNYVCISISFLDYISQTRITSSILYEWIVMVAEAQSPEIQDHHKTKTLSLKKKDWSEAQW